MQNSSRTSLLGRLATSGWFTRRAEVTTTTSMTMLLRDEPFKQSFLELLTSRTGTDLSAVSWFDAEIIHLDGGRVDIEGVDDAGTPLIMVEAKIGHYLTYGQVTSYLDDQARRLQAIKPASEQAGQQGVFVLLVPSRRAIEAERTLDAARADMPNTITALVLTWQDIIATWEHALADSSPSPSFDSPHVDLHQFTELCRAFGGLSDPSTDKTAWQLRAETWLPVVDEVTRQLSHQAPLPLVTRGDYAPYRYVATRVDDLYAAFGLQQRFADEGLSPLWMRFHKVTGKSSGGLANIRARLAQSAFAPSLRFDNGHVWIPIAVDEHLTEAELVKSLADQCITIIAQAIGDFRVIV